MSNVLIVYVSRSGETEQIANLIAEGIRLSGHTALVKKVTEIKNKLETDSFDALVLGSPTYHGEMVQGMKTMLFLSEKANLKGKVGGSFGSYGWSGEAPKQIFSTMKIIFEMLMVDSHLDLKSANINGGISIKAAQNYGREIANKLP